MMFCQFCDLEIEEVELFFDVTYCFGGSLFLHSKNMRHVVYPWKNMNGGKFKNRNKTLKHFVSFISLKKKQNFFGLTINFKNTTKNYANDKILKFNFW